MTAPLTSTLVLGGARSGKSVFAENLVLGSRLQPVYIATAQAFDDEMRARIDMHVARREGQWINREAPLELEAAIAEYSAPGHAMLVDCLTLWVTNLMMAEADVTARCATLVDAVAAARGPVVLVSNEVGMGIVPENKMARQFRDYAGRLHQDMAAVIPTVFLVAAGLPLKLKG